MRIFHIATGADWESARACGRYTTSTRGRTLAEEGYIHAARADQWQGVRERYYADLDEPLVLLVIDTDRLTAPVVEESVGGTGGETFPHVYGAIEPDAVVQVLPLGATTTPPSAAPPAGNTSPTAPAPTPVPASKPQTSNTTDRPTFAALLIEEVAIRAALGLAVMVVAVGLCFAARALWGDVAALVTILVALAAGFAVATVVMRRRARGLDATGPRPRN